MWLGLREDVADLYCAADCFVLPSLYEGFPFCLVEAQTAGLPCVVADTVSRQCALTDLLKFRSLEVDSFVDGVLEALSSVRIERCGYDEIVRGAGYDIESTTDALLVEYEGGIR